MTDAIIVGGGLFGATIARALKKAGRSVLVFDDGRPLSGSHPSGGLMKPSWLSKGFGKELEPSLAMLASLYEIQEIEFTVQPTGLRTKVMRLPVDRVLSYSDLEVSTHTVHEVLPGHVVAGAGYPFDAPLIVVAAGFWCQKLLPSISVDGKMGISFRYPGQLPAAFIRPWAPYKQIVAFNESISSVWAGDGSAIKPYNWTDERVARSLSRCSEAVDYTSDGSDAAVESRTGIRPLVKGANPCLLEKLPGGIWCATGGGKSGAAAAGWAAMKIVEATS